VLPLTNILQQRKTRLACEVHDHRLEGMACKLLLCRSRVGTMFDPDFQIVQRLPQDTNCIAFTSGRTAQLWPVGAERGRRLRLATESTGPVVFNPDGNILATAEWSSVRLWDPATGRPIGEPISAPVPASEAISRRQIRCLASPLARIARP